MLNEKFIAGSFKGKKNLLILLDIPNDMSQNRVEKHWRYSFSFISDHPV
jgi:hypothetical protein